MNQKVNIIGYSGHAYVVIDIFHSKNKIVSGYFDKEEKVNNPYHLKYLGSEQQKEVQTFIKQDPYFIAIGQNKIRENIYYSLINNNLPNPVNAIHPTSTLSSSFYLKFGIMISANVTINALVDIGIGAICNTGCIIEHECKIGDFVHIAPGAVLAGNIQVGDRSFIGANSVVKQGVRIGKDVIIGAGSVVIRDIPDGVTVVGNPSKVIKNI